MPVKARRMLVTGAVWLAVFLALFAMYQLFGFGIPCPFHLVTGLYCPGCGTMRALVSLVQFDFYQALRYNLLILVLLPVLAVQTVVQFVGHMRGQPPKSGRAEKVFIIVLAVCVVLFTIARNLPWFAILAPTAV